MFITWNLHGNDSCFIMRNWIMCLNTVMIFYIVKIVDRYWTLTNIWVKNEKLYIFIHFECNGRDNLDPIRIWPFSLCKLHKNGHCLFAFLEELKAIIFDCKWFICSPNKYCIGFVYEQTCVSLSQSFELIYVLILHVDRR